MEVVEVPRYQFTFEEVVTFLETVGCEKSVIISDNPVFKEVGVSHVDCVVFKNEIVKRGYREIVLMLSPLYVKGYVLIDQQANCGEEILMGLRSVGYLVSVFELVSEDKKH